MITQYKFLDFEDLYVSSLSFLSIVTLENAFTKYIRETKLQLPFGAWSPLNKAHFLSLGKKENQKIKTYSHLL